RDRPEECMSAERSVGRWTARRGSGERLHVDGRDRNGHGGGDRRDRETAEQDVALTGTQLEHRRACAESGDGQDAATEVIASEEERCPAVPLRGRLAGGGDREEEEADGPQRLLRSRAPAVRPCEPQREYRRDEGGGE